MRALALVLFAASVTTAQDGLPASFWRAPLVREGEYVLWRDPGPVETLDFRYGAGGEQMVPRQPFTFTDEDSTGSTAKVRVKDAAGRDWVIKFGPEASPDTFCTRLAWALGYYVEPTYFVPEGTIQSVRNLERARKEIDGRGHFEGGRFQLRTRDPKFLRYVNWSWTDNPFLNTPELGGLKVLLMLVSDWDNKDARDAESRGTNTGIYQHENLLYYFIDDWGGAMGRWGKYLTRSKWDADSFLRQSPDFVKVTEGGLAWGYVGQHSALLKEGVRPSDVRWLMQYLSRVTDDQLRTGLLSSGASGEETEKFVRAFRIRIGALARVAGVAP